MPELPLAPLGRILRKAGAERVSEDAVIAFRDVLEAIAEELAKSAVELARHANRKTVMAEDVKLAAKMRLGWPLSLR